MFGHAPVGGGALPVQDRDRRCSRPRQEVGLARRLEGRHQRFGQVHVGVLAAIVAERRPVLGEFLGAGAVAASQKRAPEPRRCRRSAGRRAGGRRIWRWRPPAARRRGHRRACGGRAGRRRRTTRNSRRGRGRDGASTASPWRDRGDRRRRGGRAARRSPRNGPCGSSGAAAARCGELGGPIVEGEEAAVGVERIGLVEAEQPVGLALSQRRCLAGAAPRLSKA